jgi:predicted HNH restriction endonuclease
MQNLQVHHLEFRSQSGSDQEQNLITLCAECHARIHLRQLLLCDAEYAALMEFLSGSSQEAK